MTLDAPVDTTPESDPDYTQRVCPSYLIGVYLAVNAVQDLYLLVEGPDCAHMKTQFVQGNHDAMSTLTSVSGFHRVANTALHPDTMSASREEGLRGSLMQLASHPTVPAVALTSMPLASITGADYDRVVREVAIASGKPAFHVPGKSLAGDWLDGYAETLHALAAQIDLAGGKPEENKVAVVGYLLDRNEGDHSANLREMERILLRLDLKLVSVWLAGRPFADLGAIRDAGTIISLPYGRRAARRLAGRTGARLLESPLPFGLPATERWTRILGDHFGRPERAEAVIDGELSRVIPQLEWVVPGVLQGLRLGYIGDPVLLPGLLEFLEVLGVTVPFAVVTNRPVHLAGFEPPTGTELLVYPKQKTFNRFLIEHGAGGRVDLLLANNAAVGASDIAVLEFGFPSIFRHALYERPFLGFGGALALIDDIANAVRASWVDKANAARCSSTPGDRRSDGHARGREQQAERSPEPRPPTDTGPTRLPSPR